MRPVAVYSALRLGLFAGCLAVLLLFGARGILAVVLAAVVSFAVSYVVLRRQRESIAQAFAAGRNRPGVGEADAAAEDATLDATEDPSRDPRR